MSELIFKDSGERPELFDWEGPVSRRRLETLLEQKGWSLPEDLLRFWEQTGGGEIFESEQILGPCGDLTLGDNVFDYNAELAGRGLPDNYCVFHTGMTLSAIRLSDNRYVELDFSDFSERRSFSSLEEWYLHLIRAEYADRYSLPAPP